VDSTSESLQAGVLFQRRKLTNNIVCLFITQQKNKTEEFFSDLRQIQILCAQYVILQVKLDSYVTVTQM